MSDLISIPNDQFKTARAARKDILPAVSAGARKKSGSDFSFDPASGALVVVPDYDFKIRKALQREVRILKRALLFRYFCLQLDYLAFEMRCASAKIICDCLRFVQNR